jgi:hypothetical protein
MRVSLLESSGHRALIGALLVASLVPVWTVEYFPSQNGPWSLLIAQMLSEYSNPALNYSAYYETSWHAIPHMLHTLVVYALSVAMPVVIAHKVAISLFIVLFPVSVFVFLEAIDPRKTVLGYASFLFVYNMPLLRGYHDYSIGLPLVLLTFAYWWRRRTHLDLKARLVIMAMTVLIYFSHIFNLSVLGLAMVLVTAWERRSARAVAAILPLFAIPFGLAIEYAWYTATHAEWVDRSERVFLTPPAAVVAFFSRFFYTLSFPAYVLTSVVVLAGSVLVLRGLTASWRQWRSGGVQSRLALTLPVLLAVMAACYLAMPYKFLNWHYANVRFIPYVLVFALACASPLGPRGARLLVGTVGLTALVSYGLLTSEFIRANDLIREYVSGVTVVEEGRTMLPVSFSGDEIGEISVVAHAADYYQVYRGGANGWGMAQFNTLTPLVYDTYPVRARFPRFERDPEASLEEVSRTYDYVLLWGDNGEAARRLAREGFEVAHEQGKLKLLRNRPRFPVRDAHVTGVDHP